MSTADLAVGAAFDVDPVTGVLSVGGAWVVHEVESLRQALVDLLPRLPAARVTVDASAIVEMDGAGVQLLVALGHALRAGGHDPVLQGGAARVLTAARVLGACDDLRCCGMVIDATEGR